MADRDWTASFPELAALEADAAGALINASKVVKLAAGTVIFAPGQSPPAFLLLKSGSVRVQKVSETGREIVLYRVSAGESCALTTACLMGYDDYQAEGIAETDVEAVAVPRATFDELIAKSRAFRRFVFKAFNERISNLMRVIDDVAFSRIDVRLAHKLIEMAGAGHHIAVTQQQLAAELGTAREVISRQLTEFQRRGWIATARGAISLTEPSALQRLAAAR